MIEKVKGRVKGKGPAAAVILALTALVISLGGTSVAQVATTALTGKDKREVRKISRGVANNRVRTLSPRLPSSRANTAGFANNAGNAQQLGGIAAGQHALRLFAVVNANGSLDRGSNVLFSAEGDAAGAYVVRFNRDVTLCSYTATIGAAVSQAAYADPGSITAEPGFGGVFGGAATAQEVKLKAYGTTGVQERRPFNLQVIC